MDNDSVKPVEDVEDVRRQFAAFEAYCKAVGIKATDSAFALFYAGSLFTARGNVAAFCTKCSAMGVKPLSGPVSKPGQYQSCSAYNPRAYSTCEAPKDFACPVKSTELQVIPVEDVTDEDR